MAYTDVIEYMMAGASAIQMGSDRFERNKFDWEYLMGLRSYLEAANISDIKEIIGIAHR